LALILLDERCNDINQPRSSRPGADLRNGESAMLDLTTSYSDPAVSARSGNLTDDQRRVIEEIIHAARPMIQADGGDIELAAVVGDIVRVRLQGACVHCVLAGQTLGGIRRQVVAALGVPVRVLPALE
jgi:Fe-S cluster biogenesis protein NfuA